MIVDTIRFGSTTIGQGRMTLESNLQPFVILAITIMLDLISSNNLSRRITEDFDLNCLYHHCISLL